MTEIASKGRINEALLNLFIAAETKVFEHLGRFDGQADGKVLGKVELVPITLVDELLYLCLQLRHRRRSITQFGDGHAYRDLQGKFV